MGQSSRFPRWMAGFSKELKNDVLMRISRGSSYEARVLLAEHEIVKEFVGDFELMVDTPGLSVVTPTALGLSLELNGGEDLGVENRLLACYESGKEVVSLTFEKLGDTGNRFVISRSLFSNAGQSESRYALRTVTDEELSTGSAFGKDGLWVLESSDVYEAKCALVACVSALSEGRVLGGFQSIEEVTDSGQLALFDVEEDEIGIGFDLYGKPSEYAAGDLSDEELVEMFDLIAQEFANDGVSDYGNYVLGGEKDE